MKTKFFRMFTPFMEGDTTGGSGGGGNTDQKPAGDNNQNGDDDKVEFTPAQQKLFEAKINEAFGKGFKKAETQLNSKLGELQTQLDKLNSKSGRGEGGDQNGKDKTYTQEDVQKLVAEAIKDPETKLADALKLVQSLKQNELRAAVVTAATRAKAVDPEDVALLVEKFVSHDENGKVVVMNEHGQPRLNSKGEPLSVDDFVKNFVDSKPHLKAGSGTGGAGSGSNNSNQKQNPGKPKTVQEANNALAAIFQKTGV